MSNDEVCDLLRNDRPTDGVKLNVFVSFPNISVIPKPPTKIPYALYAETPMLPDNSSLA